MTTSDTVSNPGFLKRIESLLELALTRAAVAFAAFVALTNKDEIFQAPMDDSTGPTANLILAAANVVRKASGIFVVFGSWQGTDSAADTVSVVLATIFGPTTAFSGGTQSSPGGTIRFHHLGGAITATGTGATLNGAANESTSAGAGTLLASASSLANFGSSPVLTQENLILFQINCTHDLSAQLVSFGYFELP